MLHALRVCIWALGALARVLIWVLGVLTRVLGLLMRPRLLPWCRERVLGWKLTTLHPLRVTAEAWLLRAKAAQVHRVLRVPTVSTQGDHREYSG
jgi:hypothetical protein